MKEVAIKSNRPHQTRFLPAVMHGETLYGPLFISFLEKRRLSLIGLIEGGFCLRCCNGETPHGPLAHRFPEEDGALPMDRAASARVRGRQGA